MKKIRNSTAKCLLALIGFCHATALEFMSLQQQFICKKKKKKNAISHFLDLLLPEVIESHMAQPWLLLTVSLAWCK